MLTYSTGQLCALASDGPPARAVRKALFAFHLWLPAYDRRPAKTCVQLVYKQTDTPTVLPTRRRETVTWRRAPVKPRRPRSQRHDGIHSSALSFGCVNVRSLNKKLTALNEVRSKHRIDVLMLTETWHDSDSVCISQMRSDGFSVVERARVRQDPTSLGTNHGGVVIAASPGVHLKQIDVNMKTCEVVAAHVLAAVPVCIALLIYRPPGPATGFFEELGETLGRLSMMSKRLVVAGDINIHVDRPLEPDTVRLLATLADHGLDCLETGPTHDLGGRLDIVAVDSGQLDTAPTVDVLDVGLSDHRLLTWTMSATRTPPVYSSVTRRSWNRVDVDNMRSAISTSALSSSSPSWEAVTDVDSLATLFDSELQAIADRLAPLRTVTVRRRPSDMWFDDECRASKKTARLAERRARQHPTHHNIDEWKECRREYFKRLRLTKEAFWRQHVESDMGRPRELWSTFNKVLGQQRAPAGPSVITADEFQLFFDQKVQTIRSSTAAAPAPSFSECPVDDRLATFGPITATDVIEAIRRLPDKQCASDVLPTRHLKLCADLLAPFLAHLFTCSSHSGLVPRVYKTAYVTPLLKKPSLDAADVKSYRPISNLSVVSKLLERIIARKLVSFLSKNDLMPPLQSAYRRGHSTETAVVKVLSDVLMALDRGELAMLAFLDLSAAFDTVDHETLLRRLQTTFGVTDKAADWLRSYLTERTQFVRIGQDRSSVVDLRFGVPQGSVLGPILFLLYTADVAELVHSHGLDAVFYADDSCIFGSCDYRQAAILSLQLRMSGCILDVAGCMAANRLQFNPDKTEIIWCGSKRRSGQLPTQPVAVCSSLIEPTETVRDLGVWLDSSLTMSRHISKTVAGCFASLRRIKSVRRSLTRESTTRLVVALVLSRLDYCNAVFAGLPAAQLNRLQSVLNAAARVIFRTGWRCHVTPLLRELHWLRVPERVTFKLCTMVYRCLNDVAPKYLACDFTRVSNISSRQRLRSASSLDLSVPATNRSTLGDRAFPVAGSRAWNSLPTDVRSANSLSAFRRHLKTFLYRRSFC